LNALQSPKWNLMLRTGILLALIVLPILTIPTVHTYGISFTMKYDLGYSGIPFAGGVVSIISNFTNTGLLTIRVTGVSFASDFWSNGTRRVTSGLPFNLTASMNKEVDTPVLIPPLGSTATALDGTPRLPLSQVSPSMYPRLSDLSSPAS